MFIFQLKQYVYKINLSKHDACGKSCSTNKQLQKLDNNNNDEWWWLTIMLMTNDDGLASKNLISVGFTKVKVYKK